MLVRKIVLTAVAVTLMALSGAAVAHDRGGGSDDRRGSHHDRFDKHGWKWKHRLGFVASGALVAHTLASDGGGARASGGDHHGFGKPTSSGTITLDVVHASRHADVDEGTTQTFELDRVWVKLKIGDRNDDGEVNLDDVAAGDRVKLYGWSWGAKSSTMCGDDDDDDDAIRKVVIRAPRS